MPFCLVATPRRGDHPAVQRVERDGIFARHKEGGKIVTELLHSLGLVTTHQGTGVWGKIPITSSLVAVQKGNQNATFLH